MFGHTRRINRRAVVMRCAPWCPAARQLPFSQDCETNVPPVTQTIVINTRQHGAFLRERIRYTRILTASIKVYFPLFSPPPFVYKCVVALAAASALLKLGFEFEFDTLTTPCGK